MSKPKKDKAKRLNLSIEDKQLIKRMREQNPKLSFKDLTLKLSESIGNSKLSQHTVKHIVYAPLDTTIKRGRPEVITAEFMNLLNYNLEQFETKNITINGELIKRIAIQLLELCHKSNMHLSIKPEHINKGFVSKFKKHTGRGLHRLYGTAPSVDEKSFAPLMENFKETINLFKQTNYSIINMDECALFFRWFGDKSLINPNNQVGRCDEKERLTVICAVEENGGKLPLSIVYKNQKMAGAKENGFFYYSEPTAWVTSDTMVDWCNDIEEYANSQNAKYLIVMDNCPAHNRFLNTYFNKSAQYKYPVYEPKYIQGNIEHPLKCEYIRFMLLPPNTTSVFQPLDAGIIWSFKSIYKNIYLSLFCDGLNIKLSTTLENHPQKEFKTFYSELPAQRKKSVVPLKKCVLGITQAWKLLDTKTIKRCFLKSKWNSEFEKAIENIPFVGQLNNTIRKKISMLKTMDIPESLKEYINDINEEQIIHSKEDDVILTTTTDNNFEEDISLTKDEQLPDNVLLDIFDLQLDSLFEFASSLKTDKQALIEKIKNKLKALEDSLNKDQE